MAKNLFEQILSKAGEIWSGSKSQGDHQVYIQDSSGLSGVAKYLAKQEQAAQPEEATTATKVSGVEKYLAKQQGSAPKTVSEAPTTGVGKYLAKQSSAKVVPPKPVIIPKTGVGKYLAGVSIATETKAASAPEKKQPPQKKPEKSKAATPIKKSTSVIPASEVPTPAPSKASTPATETAAAVVKAPAPASSGIIRFENITQCHASTVKGTQCKNTTNLTKIQRTVNKKKYQFCACTQHNNDTFKPYAPLLETV